MYRPSGSSVETLSPLADTIRSNQLPLTSGIRDLAAWLQLEPELASVYSVLGEELPGPEASQRLYDFYRSEPQSSATIPSKVLDSIFISEVTGCWLPDRYRDKGGYTGTVDNEIAITPSGSTGTHRASLARHELPSGIPTLTSDIQVDHMCRCTTCSFPGHLRRLTNQENNEFKLQARDLEKALSIGQLIMPSAMKWAEDRLNGEPNHPENPTISTRYGPFTLEWAGDYLVGRVVECAAREKLRALGNKSHKHYRKTALSVGQMAIATNELGYN